VLKIKLTMAKGEGRGKGDAFTTVLVIIIIICCVCLILLTIGYWLTIANTQDSSEQVSSPGLVIAVAVVSAVLLIILAIIGFFCRDKKECTVVVLLRSIQCSHVGIHNDTTCCLLLCL